MSEIEPNKCPRHVAIIMDGNGRWAKQRNQSRTQGHIEGVRRVEEIVDFASEIGIEALTLYTFSTENWRRPEHEINMLMNTITAVLQMKIEKLRRDNMQFRLIGRKDRIPESVMKAMQGVMDATSGNTGLTISLAFNYGARTEILDAVKSIASDISQNKYSVDEISEEIFDSYLYTQGLPDPDLLIRTSGEKRISNFLLWQLSYAEFYFTDQFWPDFTVDEFKKALMDYQSRERRYGDLGKKSKV